MKKLLITLLLISPFSFADWGDVYYCQMTFHSQSKLGSERTNYKLGKFSFKLDETKNAMVFGKQGIFKNMEMPLREGMFWPSLEEWYAEDEYQRAYFGGGKFLIEHLSIAGTISISADCEKF